MAQLTASIIGFPPAGSSIAFAMTGSSVAAPFLNLTAYLLLPDAPEPQVWASLNGSDPVVLAHLAGALSKWGDYRVQGDPPVPDAAGASYAGQRLSALTAMQPPPDSPSIAAFLGAVAQFLDGQEQRTVAKLMSGGLLTAEAIGHVPSALRVGPDKNGLWTIACGSRYGADGWHLRAPCVTADGGAEATGAGHKCRFTGGACIRIPALAIPAGAVAPVAQAGALDSAGVVVGVVEAADVPATPTAEVVVAAPVAVPAKPVNAVKPTAKPAATKLTAKPATKPTPTKAPVTH